MSGNGGWRDRAGALARDAIRRILADDAAARRVGAVLGTLQRARAGFERTGDATLRSVGLASREDWREVSRRLAVTRRRLREAARQLDRLDDRAPAKRLAGGRISR